MVNEGFDAENCTQVNDSSLDSSRIGSVRYGCVAETPYEIREWTREEAISPGVRLSEATVYVTTILGSVNLEYFFWKVISNVNGNYGGTAPNVAGIHER
ncbi:hypothetical protein FQA39_LY06531 [Lamprigera yunnana]|nr:hypothetical protein FQA39_LY06531 [Lamprigera yunnana]